MNRDFSLHTATSITSVIQKAENELLREVADNELLKEVRAVAWSSLSKQDYVNKLTQLGRKIIAIEACGQDAQRLIERIDSVGREEGILFLQALHAALHHKTIDPSIADQWLPSLRESGIFAVSKLTENVLEALKNVERLEKMIPGVSSFAPRLVEIEGRLQEMKLSAESFEKLTETLKEVEKLRREVKEIEKEIGNVIGNWERAVKIRYQLEGGTKYSRNVQMAEFTPQLGMPEVAVPVLTRVKTSEIYEFLKKHIPDFDQKRQELAKMYKHSGGTDFLRRSDVQEKLGVLRQAMEIAFSDNGFEFGPEVLKFVEEMKKEGAFLIVRSSGAEDSMQAANAGGNETVSYVNPEKEHLASALCRVVLSYFGNGSLQNQINSRQDPFSSPLQMDVVVQELIGEPLGGESDSKKIPASIVLFTNEPMYVGNELFRVMRISATWGHGEAVVGPAGIKSDNYLILRSLKHPDRLYILEDIQAKHIRLAPLKTPEGIKLMKVDNPSELVGRSTLDKSMLTRLFYYGLAVEKVYGGSVPQDMEFVVKEGRIRPVQSRPVNRLPAKPTFLDWRKIAKLPEAALEKIQGDTYLPGLAEALTIRSNREVLIVEDLAQAEEPNKDYTFNKDLHKVVIVKRPITEKNSHPVVNFSSMGVPVIYCDNIEKLEEMLKKVSEKTPLAVCTQSGNMVLCGKSPEAFISVGYVVHPAKLAISSSTIPLPGVGKPALQTQEVKNLLMQTRAIETSLQAIQKLKQTDLKEKGKGCKPGSKKGRLIES